MEEKSMEKPLGPLNGFCYTDAELDADQDLNSRVKAERLAPWEKGAIRPPVQRDDRSRNSRP